jgi:hypothetical protein
MHHDGAPAARRGAWLRGNTLPRGFLGLFESQMGRMDEKTSIRLRFLSWHASC